MLALKGRGLDSLFPSGTIGVIRSGLGAVNLNTGTVLDNNN
jgi:hypothetical protein